MKNKGFTLAEVLITIGIIGVVAALVLPALVKNHQKKALETGLKKAYSRINEVAGRYEADNGEPLKLGMFSSPTHIEEAKLRQNFIETYYNAPIYCGFYGVVGNITNPGPGCVTDSTKGYLKDHKRHFGTALAGNLNSAGNSQWVLPDGSFLMIADYDDYIYMSVDVNGPKPPNTWGKDTFMFQLMPNGRFLPVGAIGTTAGIIGNVNQIFPVDTEAVQDMYCNPDANPGGIGALYNGQTCAYKALYDNNFWKQMKL